MRRSSNAILQTQTSEPLIVVDEGDNPSDKGIMEKNNSDEESPTMNPYLLSPWRDSREVRKHSLPTPQCSGITASQVRRLSERGESSPGPKQAEFLATLCQAPAPSPGGRRHSVVTISKVPPTLFGRNRRESVATFPSSVFPGRILPNRRESIACPPSTESRGSVHNLQLDIMDDIVQARKVRMKLWNTSNEKVCEVQPLDEAGGVQRYTNSGRRYSDFVGTTLAPIPSSSNAFKRITKEVTSNTKTKPSSGIVCTNTDLISILSSLTSSATEINKADYLDTSKNTQSLSQKRSRLKGSRSNSFDISILHGVDNKSEKATSSPGPSSWFTNRHQPISSKTTNTDLLKPKQSDPSKVVWDEKSGSLVDAKALGSAIEVFLRRGGEGEATPAEAMKMGVLPKATGTVLGRYNSGKGKTGWFSNKNEEEANESCDSSLCSTLKDLFVK